MQHSLGSVRQYATVYINLALASGVMSRCGNEIQNTIAIKETA